MWSDENTAWLAKFYPGLKPTGARTLEGPLSFQMLHLEGAHYIRPASDFVAANSGRGIYLCDTYQIKVAFHTGLDFPLVYETAGRIAAIAARDGKISADLHIYNITGALCLASAMELERAFQDGFSLPIFIDEFVVPYMFAQSYYQTHGAWLWGELGHGYKGLLEWLGRLVDYDGEDVVATYRALMAQPDALEARELLQKRCRGHKPCPCGSGRKVRDCCPELKTAIARLRGARSRGGLPEQAI